jgi:hypothetical protein
MRKMLGLAAMAILIVNGIGATSAFAKEAEFLPAPNVIAKVKSGAGELSSGPVPITCTSDEGGEAGEKGGKVETTKTGHFDVLFLGCKASFLTCTSLDSKTAGSILVRGNFESVYALEQGTTNDKDPAIVFILNTVHISCGTILVKVEGSVCGLIKPVNKKVKVGEPFTVEIKGNEAEETYSKEFEGINLLKCRLFEEEDAKPESRKQAFEKTTEEIFLEKEGELMA